MDPAKVFLLFFIFYWSSLGEVTTISRYKRSSLSCNPAVSFMCLSGECIDKEKVCDGQNDCMNGDDESDNSCECGLSLSGNYINRKRPNNMEVSLGEYPWHAGVFKMRPSSKIKLLCSGTLIFPDVVLTSANCLYDPEMSAFENPETVKVGLGKLLRNYSSKEDYQQKFNVSKIVSHPRYEGDYKHYNYNIALLLLETRADINNYVRPICLWKDKKLPSAQQAWISGWGLQYSNNFAMKMKRTAVEYLNSSKCYQSHTDPLLLELITNDKFCIIFDKDGKQVIDTGASVSILDRGRYFLLGVLSITHPGTPNFAFSTFSFKYLKWIQNESYHFRMQYTCDKTKNPFHCMDSRKCVKLEKVCDGEKDCYDGSDESNCDLNIQEYLKIGPQHDDSGSGLTFTLNNSH